MLVTLLLVVVTPYLPTDLCELAHFKTGQPLTVQMWSLPAANEKGQVVMNAFAFEDEAKFFAKATGGTSLLGLYEYQWTKDGVLVKTELAVESRLLVYPEDASEGKYECKATDFGK